MPDNWTRLEKLDPDRSIIDAWHVIQHSKKCADYDSGPDTEGGRNWFDKYCGIMLDNAKGIGRSIAALSTARPGAARSSGESWSFPQEPSTDGLPVYKGHRVPDWFGMRGPGKPVPGAATDEAVGAAPRREGGRAILTFRSLLKLGRLGDACRSMVRHQRAKLPVKPPVGAPKLALAA